MRKNHQSMFTITIPGREELNLQYLVLDFNGTIALDGKLQQGVLQRLELLSQQLAIFILTADTFGTAAAQCCNLPVTLHLLQSSDHTQEKGAFVAHLGGAHVVSFGNGQNDLEMLRQSALRIGVLGEEGCAAGMFQIADLIVPGINQGLELLLYPQRLVATLRK